MRPHERGRQVPIQLNQRHSPYSYAPARNEQDPAHYRDAPHHHQPQQTTYNNARQTYDQEPFFLAHADRRETYRHDRQRQERQYGEFGGRHQQADAGRVGWDYREYPASAQAETSQRQSERQDRWGSSGRYEDDRAYGYDYGYYDDRQYQRQQPTYPSREFNDWRGYGCDWQRPADYASSYRPQTPRATEEARQDRWRQPQQMYAPHPQQYPGCLNLQQFNAFLFNEHQLTQRPATSGQQHAQFDPNASTFQPPQYRPSQFLPDNTNPNFFTANNLFPQYGAPNSLPQQPHPGTGTGFQVTPGPPKRYQTRSQTGASSPAAQPSPGGKSKTYKMLIKRPVPKIAYIRGADQQPETISEPRTLLVVLDLNGTLLYRKGRGSNFTARPQVAAFLHYLLTNHKVMVWSSATPVNVGNMCKKLFSEADSQQLATVWARDRLHLTPAQYNEKTQVYKQLSWIWSDVLVQQTARDMGEVWGQQNTILIDDSMEKAASEPHNLIRIDEFEALEEQMTTDVLGQVVKYLETVRYQKDVSTYIKRNPFVFDENAEFDWTKVLERA